MQTHLIALLVNGNNNVIYFNSFGVKHIPKEIKKFIGNENVITNIYRIQAYVSILWRCFCIVFNNFLLNSNVCLVIQIYYTNLIIQSVSNNWKDEKIVSGYFW